MTFWMGVIVGAGFVGLILTILFAWMMGAVAKRNNSSDEYLAVLKQNESHFAEIVKAIREHKGA